MNKEQLRQEWHDRIIRYINSGQSMKKWCEENGFRVHQLQYWVAKNKENKDNQANDTKWVSVGLNEATPQISKNDVIKLMVGKFEVNVQSNFNSTDMKQLLKVLIELC
jgi:hypothetical protein